MFDTFKTIVIGTSLAESSDEIVRTAAFIARTTGATPWLIHVHAAPVSSTELFGAVEGSWLEDLEAAYHDRLTEQARRTGLSALPQLKPEQLVLGVSSTYGEIVDLARRVKADLIVLGSSEGGALHRLLVGSTVDGVIRQAPCPVLVVRSAVKFPPSRVSIPVDLSPLSANALRLGTGFLERLGMAMAGVEVLFVLNPLEVRGSLHFTPTEIESFAGEQLQTFLKLNGGGALPSQVRTGYPAEEINAVLEERGADLVILGTHGRRGFERLMVGSVAFGVLHRAACNLLIVPPGARLQREAGIAHGEEKAREGGFVHAGAAASGPH
jgi:nucleotide-binding universal stress UspA family protein